MSAPNESSSNPAPSGGADDAYGLKSAEPARSGAADTVPPNSASSGSVPPSSSATSPIVVSSAPVNPTSVSSVPTSPAPSPGLSATHVSVSPVAAASEAPPPPPPPFAPPGPAPAKPSPSTATASVAANRSGPAGVGPAEIGPSAATAETPPTADETAEEVGAEAALGELQTRSRMMLYGGLALMGLAFVLSWWSITKYRVSYERGVNLEVPADKQQMLDGLGDEKADYQRELDEYAAAWALNLSEYHNYYVAHFGIHYQNELDQQIKRSLKSGTLYYRGWSTWTGWLGILTIAAFVGIQVAPRFKPEEMEPYVWTAPWVAAGLGGLYLLLALAFFFSEPDENGAGYSQGIAWGDYIAILAGLATTLGGLGLGLTNARLKASEEEPDEEEAEVATSTPVPTPAPSAKRPAVAPSAAKPPEVTPPEQKNRLMDW